MDKERFPGEREPDTAMPTQEGITGTTGFGGDLSHADESIPIDEEKRREARREGGGEARPTSKEEG